MTAWRRFVTTSVRRRSQRSIRLPANGPSTTETASSIRNRAAVSVPDDVSVKTYTGSATRSSQSPVSLTSPPAQTSRKSRPDHGEGLGGAVVASQRHRRRSDAVDPPERLHRDVDGLGVRRTIGSRGGDERSNQRVDRLGQVAELVGGHRQSVRRERGGILPLGVERVGLVHVAAGRGGPPRRCRAHRAPVGPHVRRVDRHSAGRRTRTPSPWLARPARGRPPR